MVLGFPIMTKTCEFHFGPPNAVCGKPAVAAFKMYMKFQYWKEVAYCAEHYDLMMDNARWGAGEFISGYEAEVKANACV
jgi:hypothetical protein